MDRGLGFRLRDDHHGLISVPNPSRDCLSLDTESVSASNVPYHVLLGDGAATMRSRAGSHQPAIAPPSDSAAETIMAAANPAVKSAGEWPALRAEKVATRSATPNTPPRNRPMLKMPEAFPISTTATELSTAF